MVRSLKRSNSFKSFFICSSHVLLSLHRLLLPYTIMFVIRLTEASKVFLSTCRNHLNIFAQFFAERKVAPSFSVNSWFLILYIIVHPRILLSIDISVTFILCSKVFFTAQHSFPCNKANLIAIRKIYLLTYLETSYNIGLR